MKQALILTATLLLAPPTALPAVDDPIDRHDLVTRHNITWNDLRGEIPIGNGEFCFNADATGLQTFGGSTMSHWAWHTSPLPAGCTALDIPASGTIERGRITGPMREASGRGEVDGWMFRNPHPINLVRLRLVRSNGEALKPDDVGRISRGYDLWTGLHSARYEVDGQSVVVETCVHPELSLVAVRIESPMLRDQKLVVRLDFPYPLPSEGPWEGRWDAPDRHSTQLTTKPGRNFADILRTADASTYSARVQWAQGCALKASSDQGRKHSFVLGSDKFGRLEFVCGFAEHQLKSLPDSEKTRRASAEHWKKYWTTSGAIDLSRSRDPRWKELERRIVLSQYQVAAQSAGSWPPAENGLTGVDFWSSQFHMEMVWWHVAHYGLWDRWPMAEKALDCYQKFLPVARQLAQQFDYKGAKWGKQVGPEGRTAPWDGSFVLHWQQPHPIFFAELEYRLHPSRATLKKWQEVVFETANYMACFPVRDEKGVYHLKPVMPACEEPTSYDTVFELAYWRFGLEKAQEWRQRLGLPRDPKWDEVRNGLAPLPTHDGVYVLSPERLDRQGGSHPDAIGVYGMLPRLDGVDPAIAAATVNYMVKDRERWKCMGWGWDFPWMAMAAARNENPGLAVEALLHPSPQNNYDQRGICTGGPCPYLPGNGGLLYAVAMMAAGWDGGPASHAPGFPDDGSWVVKWEGLRRAP